MDQCEMLEVWNIFLICFMNASIISFGSIAVVNESPCHWMVSGENFGKCMDVVFCTSPLHNNSFRISHHSIHDYKNMVTKLKSGHSTLGTIVLQGQDWVLAGPCGRPQLQPGMVGRLPHVFPPSRQCLGTRDVVRASLWWHWCPGALSDRDLWPSDPVSEIAFTTWELWIGDDQFPSTD